MGLPTQPIPNSAKAAPYGMLRVSLILMTIAVAWGVLVIASATQLGTDWLRKVGGFLLLAAIGTGYWAKRTWSEIIRIELEPTFRQKHRSFALKAGIAICAVLLLAAEEGIRVGTHGRHRRNIVALTKELEALTTKSAPTAEQFVQIARQATPTMQEYIQRCNNLEAVLNDYESNLRDGDRVLGQVVEELQQLQAYKGYAAMDKGYAAMDKGYAAMDKGYVAMIPMFTVLQNLEHKGLESALAFRKEVDYGKQLAALTPDDQVRFYKANILPVKSDEKRIANEELDILKDAKAHGLNLPESLYREAGIQ
jgi:hypothetical protein